MKKLVGILSAGLLFIMVGCASFPGGSGPSICDGVAPEDSLICQKIPKPENVDVLLQLANLEAIKYDAYTATQAEEFLNRVISFVETVENWQDLVTWITLQMDEVPAEFIILSKWAPQFNTDAFIKPLDKEMLLYHLNNQLQLVQMMKGRG